MDIADVLVLFSKVIFASCADLQFLKTCYINMNKNHTNSVGISSEYR